MPEDSDRNKKIEYALSRLRGDSIYMGTEFNLTRSAHGHVGMHFEAPSLRDRPIEDLVDALREAGVEIEPTSSLKTVGYGRGHGDDEGMSNVPLLTPLSALEEGLTEGTHVAVEKYILRGGGLTLELYEHRSSSGFARDRIGGSGSMVAGVKCKVTFEGTYEEGAVIEKAREVMRKFYVTKTEKQIAEDMKDFKFSKEGEESLKESMKELEGLREGPKE